MDVPILGEQPQQGGAVNVLFDIHDSELKRAMGVIEEINRKHSAMARDLETFRKEVIHRFEDAGIKADVKVFETNVVGVYWFDVDLLDRLEGEFDPDRQVHEVTSDILGTGDGGVIKSGMRGPLD
jgi:hypothetical protein